MAIAPEPATPASAVVEQAVSPTLQEPITIPLDAPTPVRRNVTVVDGDDADEPAPTLRRTPSRRDSMRRRELLLKGKEGSRRRQRWENDNFLNHPAYVPPQPEDFLPRPLYPKREVRYEFAALWDPNHPGKYGYASTHAVKPTGSEEKRVPKELKHRLKRSKGAMDMLKQLEEEVRRYAATLWGVADEHSQVQQEEEPLEKSVNEDDMKDSEDEEIVFIPRMKTVTLEKAVIVGKDSERQKKVTREVYVPILETPLQKSVYEASPSDPGASFGRWLVHSIALYYGLRSWSITEGNPAMRIAFVGVQPSEKKKRRAGIVGKKEKTLPRPLWMLL